MADHPEELHPGEGRVKTPELRHLGVQEHHLTAKRCTVEERRGSNQLHLHHMLLQPLLSQKPRMLTNKNKRINSALQRYVRVYMVSILYHLTLLLSRPGTQKCGTHYCAENSTKPLH